MNKFTVVLACTLFSGLALDEAEFKTLLTEQAHSSLISKFVEKGNKIKLKEQTNYYFDTENFLLKHNGTNLRIRFVKGKPAELTIKDRAYYTEDIYQLEKVIADEALLVDKNEYECLFASTEVAQSFVDEPSKILSMTESDCKTIEENFEGIHPIAFLNKIAGERKFYIPGKETKANKAEVPTNSTSLGSSIGLRANNHNVRNVVYVSYAGVDLNLEVDHTSYGIDYQSFGADLDVTKVSDQGTIDKIQAEYTADIRSVTEVVNASLGGKTTRTFIISGEQWDTVDQLIERKELFTN
mgnify:FL=1